MFRLNLLQGLPVVVIGAENLLCRISNSLVRKGAHLEFPGAYGGGSYKVAGQCDRLF